MDSLSNDIIKYKKGELSPEQMHALERRAFADPFLADALEGQETISVEELVADISSIEKNIFRKKKTILFTPLRIAAGVILVAASIFMIYQFVPKAETLALKTEKPKPENKNEEVEKPEAGSGKEVEKVESQKLKIESEGRKLKKPTPVSRRQNPVTSPDVHLDQQPVPIATETDKQDVVGEVQSSIQQAPVQDLAAAEEQSAKIENENDQLSKKIVTPEPSGAGAKIIAHDKKKDSFAASEAQRSAVPSAKLQPRQLISGQVVAAEDNSPLPGVNVIVKGTSIGTVTDLNGNYSISPDPENRSLVFSFIGLQQEEVNASGKSKIDIQMKDDVSQLSEVVVTGVGLTKDEDHEPVIRLAEPVGGKKAYDNYLESNLKYPEEARKNKIKGKAGIEFKVSRDGSLSDFRVIKKLGYGCEEEIIRLVKEGPGWTPSTEDNKPIESTVKVRLRFDPVKTSR